MLRARLVAVRTLTSRTSGAVARLRGICDGTFDLDAELELVLGTWQGQVRFEGKTDVAYLNKLIAHYVL